jgi:hypothetical protein
MWKRSLPFCFSSNLVFSRIGMSATPTIPINFGFEKSAAATGREIGHSNGLRGQAMSL